MSISKWGILILISTMLASCSNNLGSSCAGDSVIESLSDALSKKAVADARKEIGASDPSISVTTSKLNAIFHDFKVALDDVRTVRDDPNSTKLYCAARLGVKIPKEILDKADSARAMADLESLQQFANVQDVDLEGSTLLINAEYSVQPTDDGAKLFAELDGGTQLTAVLKEVIMATALEQQIRSKRAEEDRENAALAREERLASDAEEAANAEAAKAALAESKENLNLANQRINAVWASLPKQQRQKYLALQRAWIARRIAECRATAAGSSEFAEMRESNRLTCEARMTHDRADQLESLRSPDTEQYEGDADSPEAE
mgnify:CR=1 FL=1